MCRAIAGACRKLLKLWNLSTAKLKRRFRQNWAEMAANLKLFECSGFGFREGHS
jgi:hypothetical protein